MCRLSRRPHELLGLRLPPLKALSFDVQFLRARRRWRSHRAKELIRQQSGAQDFGIGMVVSLLADMGIEG